MAIIDGRDNNPSHRRVLPVVVDMCVRINTVFVRYVGPIADEIVDGMYRKWLETGSTGPSGIGRYITLLSQHIADEEQRTSFGDEARTAMRDALGRRG
jgi:hypothetical protein